MDIYVYSGLKHGAGQGNGDGQKICEKAVLGGSCSIFIPKLKVREHCFRSTPLNSRHRWMGIGPYSENTEDKEHSL